MGIPDLHGHLPQKIKADEPVCSHDHRRVVHLQSICGPNGKSCNEPEGISGEAEEKVPQDSADAAESLGGDEGMVLLELSDDFGSGGSHGCRMERKHGSDLLYPKRMDHTKTDNGMVRRLIKIEETAGAFS